MAITVDWKTFVIQVPLTDLTLVQATPTVIYDMDLNWFRLQLHDIMDSSEGMPFPRMFSHNTEVTLGGLTFARVIEILAPYTVTFSDEQAAVNLTGANSNVGDRVNVNQVSVRSQNSAGMTSSPDIEYSSFNGQVSMDVVKGFAGTVFPTGTPRRMVNNLTDAMLIANTRGFDTIFINSNAVIDSGADYRGINFVGNSLHKTVLTISSESLVSECEFYSATIEGTLDDNAVIKHCMIEDLNYVSGEIRWCTLKPPGIMVLGGTKEALIVNCVTECTYGGRPYTIDYNGAGRSLAVRNMNGAIRLINKTGPEDSSVIMDGGKVILDMNTLVNGRIKIAGIATVVDTQGNMVKSGTYGDLVVINSALSNESISNYVLDSIA